MAAPILAGGAAGVSNTAVFVKGNATQIAAMSIYNPNAAAVYVQLFDGAAAPTVGTTVPKWSVGIAASSALSPTFPNEGLLFDYGLWVAATTTAGGAVAPAATVNVNLAIAT